MYFVIKQMPPKKASRTRQKDTKQTKETKATKATKESKKETKQQQNAGVRSYSKYEFEAYDDNGLVIQKRLVVQTHNGVASGYLSTTSNGVSTIQPINRVLL